MKRSEVNKLMVKINENKLRLKKQLLPKLLRKLLVEKLKKHFKTVKFGLLTLKQDKQIDRVNKLMNLVRVMNRKYLMTLRTSVVKLASCTV